MSRITITAKRNGRVYLGMSPEQAGTLIIMCDLLRDYPFPENQQELAPHMRALGDAARKHIQRVRKGGPRCR